LTNKTGKGFGTPIPITAADALPAAGLFPQTFNPAESIYNRLGKYFTDFEAALDDEHEIGVRLVSFGSSAFHIERLGYHGTDTITFYGLNEKFRLPVWARGRRQRVVSSI
jgi:hypothetical protein